MAEAVEADAGLVDFVGVGFEHKATVSRQA